VAERYDDRDAATFEPAVVDPVGDFLVDVAGEGAALELGIGTGRIALPLAQRGVRVKGIDLSPSMVARLRAKPGAEDIEVRIGDFATTMVDGAFSVAYLVVNTIMNLTTQEEQVACFRNVRRIWSRAAASSSRSAFRSCSDCRPARPSAPSTSVPHGSGSTSTTGRRRA